MLQSHAMTIIFSAVALTHGEAPNSLDMLVDSLSDKLFRQVLQSWRFRLDAPKVTAGASGLSGAHLPRAGAAALRPLGVAATHKYGQPPPKKFGKLPRQVRRSALATESATSEGPKSKEFEDGMNAASRVLKMLEQGNQRYIDLHRGKKEVMEAEAFKPADVEDPDNLQPLEAVVIMCPTVFTNAADIFQVGRRTIQSVEAAGCVCQPYDSIVASVEYLVQKKKPPLVFVLGNSLSYPIRSAVRKALYKTTNESYVPWFPNDTALLDGYREDQSSLTDILLPSAEDAVAQQPHGSVRRMCELANRLNVFNTVEILLRSSKCIREAIQSGATQVHGAYLDQRSGKVQFMGEHPLNEKILQGQLVEDVVRTAGARAVPSDEAFANLWAGNQRFALDRAGRQESEDAAGLSRLEYLATQGQNPLAVLLGCSDSGAPTERIFDAQPGDIFAIRNAGNICENSTMSKNAGCSTVGSAEYAIQVLGTRLFVVMGHTDCGAITAAVEKALEDKEALTAGTAETVLTQNTPDTIGNMLVTIRPQAMTAVNLKSTWEEQVNLAGKLNVFATVEKMIRSSEIVRSAIRAGELEIYGAMYNLSLGKVVWLGTHRKLEELVHQPLPVQRWKEAKFISGQYTIDHYGGFLGPNGSLIVRGEVYDGQPKWAEAVKELKRGNERFLRNQPKNQLARSSFVYDKSDPRPYALVLSGAEEELSLRSIFDAGSRDMLVQRTIGNIAGTSRGTVMASLEYQIIRFAPKVILVLAESDSEVVKDAIQVAAGESSDELPKAYGRTITRLTVSAVRAMRNVAEHPQETSAGTMAKILRLTVELNALYYIEKLLKLSAVIRHAVRTGATEIHAAVLNEDVGEVDFLGPHPMQDQILSEFK